MLGPDVSKVLQRLRKAVDPAPDATDRDLLSRFLTSQDEAAFEALVRRHERLVRSAIGKVVTDPDDAEDAFQATFYVLVRRAKQLDHRAGLGPWLYGVAHRVAVKSRATSRTRARLEARAAPAGPTAPPDLSWQEACELLHTELDRLPEAYRTPLLLCYLEGKSRDEVAALLGVTTATVRGRLERGREKLRVRLARRGVTLSVGLLVAVVAPRTFASGSAQTVAAVLSAVRGAASARVVALSQETIMFATLSKLIVSVVLAVGLIVAAATLTAAVAPKPDAAPPGAVNGEKAAPEAGPLRPEKAQILVLGPDGKPVAGAMIRRLSRDRFEALVETVLGRTDANGRFSAEVVSPCTFTAVAEDIGAAWSESETRGRDLVLKMAPPLPIKGRLVDLQGKPIAGAKVRVESIGVSTTDDLTATYNTFRVNPDWVGATLAQLDGSATGAPPAPVTDKDGRFELKNVGRNRVVRVRFLADGIESMSVSVIADPEFPKRMKPPTDAEKHRNLFLQHKLAVYGPEFTHAARPEHRITGTVVDAVTGKPVPGVTVWGTIVPVYPTLSNGGFPWSDKAMATTDAKGQFELTGLPKALTYDLPFLPKEPRRYLQIRAEGAPYLDTVVVVPDTADYTPATVAVKLRPAVTVTGRLVNKVTGKPVRGTVHWFGLEANEPLTKGLAEGDEVALLFARRYTFTLPSGVQRETDDEGRFHLQVPPGPGVIFAGAAADPSAVFTSARVRAEDRKSLRDGKTVGESRSTGPSQDPDDEAFTTVGIHWPIRWANEYAIINPGVKDKSVEVKMALDPGAAVKLAVTDPDGKPLSGVTLVGDGPFGQRVSTFATAEIEVGGLIPNGRPRQLCLLHRERKLCAELQVKGDEKGPVAVTLQPCATVTGRVVDHTGKPVPGARVTFQMAEFAVDRMLRQNLFRDSQKTTTDADGRFTFERMFPGHEFDLLAAQAGFTGVATNLRVQLKPSETKDVGELKLPEPKKLDE